MTNKCLRSKTTKVSECIAENETLEHMLNRNLPKNVVSNIISMLIPVNNIQDKIARSIFLY